MAANISNSPQRFDYARTEHDDVNDASNQAENNANPDQQTPSQTPTSVDGLTEQQGQSSGDGAGSDAGAHEPATQLPLYPPEEAMPLPAQYRYGLGEVSIGRPDYSRAYADRALPGRGDAGGGEREPRPRNAAFAPPSQAAANVSKPIPMPKPGSTTAPIPPTAPPPPSSTTTPYSSLFVPGNAAWEEANYAIDSPVIYPSSVPARDAGVTSEAYVYAAAHGLSAQDTAKLAALMANNHSPGREWLSLRPEVMTQVLDAVKANPNGTFDVSSVFGGALGYYDARINTPIQARLDENGSVVTETGSSESSSLTPIHREGWVYQAGDDGGPEGVKNFV